jgi:hypothetical protein
MPGGKDAALAARPKRVPAKRSARDEESARYDFPDTALPGQRALICRIIRSALVLSGVPFRTDC